MFWAVQGIDAVYNLNIGPKSDICGQLRTFFPILLRPTGLLRLLQAVYLVVAAQKGRYGRLKARDGDLKTR